MIGSKKAWRTLPSRWRVFALGGLYLAILAVVWGGLGLMMLGQNETWLVRSYKNRWAFKDVPTRRGAITDRTGRVLVQDRPSSTLELHYWAFRRYHPIGTAVHGAELWRRQIHGKGKPFDFRRAVPALRTCLRIPVQDLSETRSDRRTARDLRFYVCSLLAELTNRSHGRIRLLLVRAMREGRDGTVAQVVGLDAEALLPGFVAFLDELLGLDRDLERELRIEFAKLSAGEVDERIAKRGLLGRLEHTRAEYAAERQEKDRPTSDHRVVAVHRKLPHELALQVAARRERLFGLTVRASVSRRRPQLASLAPFLGRVAPAFWRKDQRDRDQAKLDRHLEELEPLLSDLTDSDPELDDTQQRVLRREAERAVQRYLRGHGRIGSSGAEESLDAVLSGNPGMRFVERSRRAGERRLWHSFEVTPGKDVALAFDLRLQALLEAALEHGLADLPEEQAAAMAVIDARTGEVLAMAGRPLDSKRLPSWWSWSSAGDLGSVAKPFVLLEQLDAMRHGRGYADPRKFRECGGLYRKNLGCDHSHFADAKDPIAALGRSCNFFYYQAAEGLGTIGVLNAFSRVGLVNTRSQTPDLRGRIQPNIPGLPWQRFPKIHRKDNLRRAIGYGIEANVLQVARAYAAIATGVLPELSFIVRKPGDHGKAVPLNVHTDDLQVVRDGMQFCVTRGTATLQKGFGYQEAMVKTGTATVGPTRRSKINNAWLAGFVTRDKPTLAFACVVYYVEGYGAEKAGPIVRHFLTGIDKDPQLKKVYR